VGYISACVIDGKNKVFLIKNIEYSTEAAYSDMF